MLLPHVLEKLVRAKERFMAELTSANVPSR